MLAYVDPPAPAADPDGARHGGRHLLAAAAHPGRPGRGAARPGSVAGRRSRSLARQLGLDRSLVCPARPTTLRSLLQGDMGRSIFQNQPVSDIIAGRLGATVELAVVALLIAIVDRRHARRGRRDAAGLDRRHGDDAACAARRLDAGLLAGHPADAGLCRDSSAGCRRSAAASRYWSAFGAALTGRPRPLLDSLAHILLPALALGANSAAIISRLVRTSMLEVLREDFVRTAYAKGLRRPRVIIRHALRNALLPVISVIGLRFGALARRRRADREHLRLARAWTAHHRGHLAARPAADPGHRADLRAHVRARKPRRRSSLRGGRSARPAGVMLMRLPRALRNVSLLSARSSRWPSCPRPCFAPSVGDPWRRTDGHAQPLCRPVGGALARHRQFRPRSLVAPDLRRAHLAVDRPHLGRCRRDRSARAVGLSPAISAAGSTSC